MCWWFKKKPVLINQPVITNSSPRTEGLELSVPSPAYLDGQMPTYNIPDLIKHLEFRAWAHETYLGLLESGDNTYAYYGSENHHKWAIEGYKNAIYYLRGNGDGTD